MESRSPQAYATISNEVKQHNLKFGGAPASAVNDYSIPLYTHADPDEFDMRIRGGVTLRSHAHEKGHSFRKWPKSLKYMVGTE